MTTDHYDGLMDPDTAARWAGARNLPEVAELVAQWLEGDLPSQVGYAPNVGPDAETTNLVPLLARLNRAGLLTDCSQPGFSGRGFDGAKWRQRAAVSGFIAADRDDVIGWLDEALVQSGLAGIVCKPLCDRSAGRPGGLVMTTRAGRPYTWFGVTRDRLELEDCYAGCAPTIIDALWTSAYQVVVFDPQWGRNDRLWPALEAAIPQGVIA